MRDCFVTDDFVLDLSNVAISYVEQNPRFKDTFFTRYSFPFTFYIDADLRAKMGDYSNLNAVNLLGSFQGWHIMEGRRHKGVLEILEVEGKYAQAQIDSGFEELPNFSKKLSQLPLNENIPKITNIATHADEVVKKKYPDVTYNFPRVIYNKHKADEEGWEKFNQFINDIRDGKMVSNEMTGVNIVNRNIIHPMPYLLHVLKVGFADAGYELAGDILEDEDFKQRLIFSFDEANVVSGETELNIDFATDEPQFEKVYSLKKLGYYELIGNLKINNGYVTFKLNDKILFSRSVQYNQQDLQIHHTFTHQEANGFVKIIAGGMTTGNSNVSFSGKIRERIFVKNGEKTKVFFTPDQVNLQNSVPDMTFGDLVKTIKNWKNFDIEIREKKIFMNRIQTKGTNPKDFSQFETETPQRIFNHKRSFSFSLAEISHNYGGDSVLIDKSGININKEGNSNTTQIKVDAYCLPVETYRGVTTASIKKEDNSTLALIFYNGLYEGSNYAQNPSGLMLPEIIKVWQDWFTMRVQNTEIKWSFFAKKSDIRDVNVRDTLHAYGRKLWIKEITKDSINPQMYKVDIVTEVI